VLVLDSVLELLSASSEELVEELLLDSLVEDEELLVLDVELDC